MDLRKKLTLIIGLTVSLWGRSFAQIPDLVTGLDAGGRAMGMGGSLYGTSADTYSALSNPAGLAYIKGRQVTVAFRNLPESTTIMRNNFRNPDLSTKAGSGDMGLSHAGMTSKFRNGNIAATYTKIGHISDRRGSVGDLTLDAGTSVRNYLEKQRANLDLFTVSYGQAANSGMTWGFGLMMASTYVRNTQQYDLVSGGNANPTTPLDISGSGGGIGFVAGVQMVPKNNSTMVYGASIRTPIDLQNNKKTELILDTIPGRVEVSAAKRMNNFHGENNYLLIGANMGRTFGADYGQLFQRKGQFFGGIGAEFNRLQGNARMPIRVGYQMLPAAGKGFKDRNALTFGLSYRPLDQNYSIDLNFATTSGSYDRGISVTYRMK